MHIFPFTDRRVIAFAGLFACCMAGCHQEPTAGDSRQEQTDTPARSEQVERPEGEHLLAEPPTGWVQGFFTETTSLRMVEYLPEDPGAADWVEKVTFESFSAEDLPDPIEFVTSIATDQASACENFEHFNILSDVENGYPTSVRFMVCPESSLVGMGQVTLIKAMQGNDRFYVITRAKRVAVAEQGEQTKAISDAEMAVWSAYMRAIGLCDAGLSEEHPCPE